MHYEVRRHADQVYADLVRDYWMGVQIENWGPKLMEQLVNEGYCVPDPDDENYYIFKVYPKGNLLNKMVAYHGKVLPLGVYLSQYDKSHWSRRQRLRAASQIFIFFGFGLSMLFLTPLGNKLLFFVTDAMRQ